MNKDTKTKSPNSLRFKKTHWLTCLLLFGFAVLEMQRQIQAANSPDPYANEPAAQGEARMAWWREARFGIFIHWGVYSEAGGEWKGATNYAEWLQFQAKIPIAEYTELARKFNPQKFDADAWVKVAKDAGMKYLVITAKHHDGFAMYDSPSDSYNIVKVTPFKRDPIKELAGACRRQGIRFCVYYSLGRDWHDPDVPTGTPGSKSWPPGCRSNLTDFPDESKKDFAKYFERKVKPQVRELLTQYGPIGIMWFDTPGKISRAQSVELLAMIRELQPDCIVNVRIGNGLGDYGTPEQEIPSGKSAKPWETCMTINRHWGYNKADLNWKSPEELLRNLIDITSKGGNYLLNVGPTGEGVIPQPEVNRLETIGQWLKVNGEAIYGTTASPFNQLTWGRCTKRISGDETTLYLHVFNWPTNGTLLVPGLRNHVEQVCLLKKNWLGHHQVLKAAKNSDGVSIVVPKTAPDKISSTIVLKIKGALEIAPTPVAQGTDGSMRLSGSEADLHGGLRYKPGEGKEKIGYWTEPADTVSRTLKIV